MNHGDPEKPRSWFPAKTYGWGWGPPSTWQGWLVLLGYLVLLVLAIVVFPPERNRTEFLASEGILTGVLIVVCWWKGEPPRWRWGR